jgi:hypothetical protein
VLGLLPDGILLALRFCLVANGALGGADISESLAQKTDDQDDNCDDDEQDDLFHHSSQRIRNSLKKNYHSREVPENCQ